MAWLRGYVQDLAAGEDGGGTAEGRGGEDKAGEDPGRDQENRARDAAGVF